MIQPLYIDRTREAGVTSTSPAQRLFPPLLPPAEQQRNGHRSLSASAATTTISCLMVRGLSIPLVVCSLLGCTTLSTQIVDPPSGQINGMLYHLPIGKITISGSFEDITLPLADGQTIAGSVTPADQSGAAAPTATPTATPAAVATQLKLTLTAEVEADEDAGVHYAVPHANYMYEDDVHVKVSVKRLLETGHVKTEDKTVAIVQEITSLASLFEKRLRVQRAASRLPFDFTFRPSAPSEYDKVRKELAARGITFEVDPEPDSADKTVAVHSQEAKELGKRGLLFRPAIVYNVRVKFGEVLDKRQQFALPDPSRTYVIAYPRISFIKREKNIGFTDGMLTDFHQVTPSPILGFLGLPKAIIQALLPVPGR